MTLTEESRSALTRWLADGSTEIGVFENKALDSADCGRRVAIPFEKGAMDSAEIGKCRAPDMPTIGAGWKYILVAKCSTVEDAERALEEGS